MNGIVRKASASPDSNLSSAESFISNEEPNLHESEQYGNRSPGATLNNLTFEKIEECNRLAEIRLKKLHIQTGLSKETKN